jgi:hypothetical protein
VPGFNCKINCYEGSQLASYVERVLNQILMGEHDNSVSSVPETGLDEELQELGSETRPNADSTISLSTLGIVVFFMWLTVQPCNAWA